MKYLVALLLCACLPLSASKNRNWQDALLVSTSTDDTGRMIALPVGPNVVAATIYETRYIFETRDLILTLASNGRRALNFTVNKSSQLAIDKQDAFVIDDSGKEIKLRIIGKRAK